MLGAQDPLPGGKDKAGFGFGLLGLALAGEDGRDPVPGGQGAGMLGTQQLPAFLASTCRNIASASAWQPRSPAAAAT